MCTFAAVFSLNKNNLNLTLLKVLVPYSCLLLTNPLYGQFHAINGFVSNELGNPLPYVSIKLESVKGKLLMATLTNPDGEYSLENIPKGAYNIRASIIGYAEKYKMIKIPTSENVRFSLQPSINQLDDVTVRGKSITEEKKAMGYALEVIEVKQQKNLTADINQVLRATSGINLRETGGLGSGFSLSLNGLSGNQIRYFLDGIPMENFGSSLTLNNYPINLIESIEIYKGVVPVSLGADALGGAIDIKTGYKGKSFLDGSYSYGSFATQRLSFNGQYTNKHKTFFARISSFVNHSNNNYQMQNVPLFDLELGNHLGTTSIKRFHNTYTSAMGRLEIGLLNRKYADEWSLSMTGAFNRKNYQHPDNNIKRVFGAFHTTNSTFLVSTNYKKSFAKLEIKGYVLAGKVVGSTLDTSNLKYNWSGKSIKRDLDDPKGELYERRSLFRLNDLIINNNIGTSYTIKGNHRLSVNFTHNYLKREGKDEVDEYNRSFEAPNFIHKSILGAEYTFQSDSKTIEATLFGKQYWYSGKMITQDYSDNDIITKLDFDRAGYGTAISYLISKNLRLKFSFEKAYRIPESFEILGDGIYINPNAELQPEKSYNANLGGRYKTTNPKSSIVAEFNYFYRFSKDFIRFAPLGPFGNYENLNNVRTTGIEGSFHIDYAKSVLLDLNMTYQSLTDQTEFDEGLRNANFRSRIPNIPYLFGNLRIGIKPIRAKQYDFTIYWNTRYVHEFFLKWENLGDPSTKHIIPKQLIHNLELDCSLEKGKYNASLSINNIANALAYDNFNIQKPGRAIYFKIRYFLM